MSDLFKKNASRLSEDEERRLWQRVRAVPDEVEGEGAADRSAARARPLAAPGGRPWWRGLFRSPAFRYGAPALAVLVAAVLFVIEREPHAPVPGRPAAETRALKAAPDAVTETAPLAETPAPIATQVPAPAEPRAKVGAKLGAPAASAPGLAPQEEAQGVASGLEDEHEVGGADQKAADRLALKDATRKETAANRAPEGARGRAAESRFALPPEATRERVTVIKGGKQTSEVPAPGVATAESVSAQRAAIDRATHGGIGDSDKAIGRVDALSEMSVLVPGGASPWEAVIAGTSDAPWIEIIRSEFDPGSVVVLGGSRDARVRLYTAARITDLERPAPSGAGAASEWFERRPGTEPSATLEIRTSGGAPAIVRRSAAPRVSFRDAPHAVQVAYLAAEAERATRLSSAPTARTRFDRILTEARALAARRPNDARVKQLIALLTEARARVR